MPSITQTIDSVDGGIPVWQVIVAILVLVFITCLAFWQLRRKRALYSGDQIIAEYDGSGTLLRKFVYGPGIDEPICLINVSSSETYYYHFDGLGSVIALSNENSEIVERYSYDVFGEPNRTSDIGNPYFFTGRAYDSEVGLYYYRARYYSPSIGRFLQTDPVGYYDSMNLYQYCENTPVRFRDPYGLFMAPWHYYISYIAARESGYSVWESMSIAAESSMWDFAGTAGYDASSANSHGMAGQNPNGNGTFTMQERNQAIEGHQGFVDTALLDGYIGPGLHAAEDRFASGHAFKEWTGFGLNMKTLEHILDDIYPSTDALDKAIVADMDLLKQQQQKDQGSKN